MKASSTCHLYRSNIMSLRRMIMKKKKDEYNDYTDLVLFDRGLLTDWSELFRVLACYFCLKLDQKDILFMVN